METSDILTALNPLIKVLSKLSIQYYIGGSIASSVFGMPRSTLDVDLIADIRIKDIPSLKHYLENEYCIDEDMIKDAIIRSSSFNLIHLKTAIKIDVFIQKDDEYQKNLQYRKQKDTLDENDSESEFYFSSPEDIILNKLQWYEMGQRVSERQWLDVLGVIKVQRDLLDKSYLKRWAEKLGISELLKEAFENSGVTL